MSAKLKFCSKCGQKFKTRRTAMLPADSHCAACKPRFALRRFAWLSILAVCSIASFTIGRYTAPAEPFNFLGTPVQLEALSSLANQPNPHGNDAVETPPMTGTEEFISSCGAPTKAGHPCRRKVHGWGYCWQHRDKLGKKPLPKEPELLNKIEKAGIALQ